MNSSSDDNNGISTWVMHVHSERWGPPLNQSMSGQVRKDPTPFHPQAKPFVASHHAILAGILAFCGAVSSFRGFV